MTDSFCMFIYESSHLLNLLIPATTIHVNARSEGEDANCFQQSHLTLANVASHLIAN